VFGRAQSAFASTSARRELYKVALQNSQVTKILPSSTMWSRSSCEKLFNMASTLSRDTSTPRAPRCRGRLARPAHGTADRPAARWTAPGDQLDVLDRGTSVRPSTSVVFRQRVPARCLRRIARIEIRTRARSGAFAGIAARCRRRASYGWRRLRRRSSSAHRNRTASDLLGAMEFHARVFSASRLRARRAWYVHVSALSMSWRDGFAEQRPASPCPPQSPPATRSLSSARRRAPCRAR